MDQYQLTVPVVELPDVGVRQARELADRVVRGDLGSGQALLVAGLQRRLNVGFH